MPCEKCWRDLLVVAVSTFCCAAAIGVVDPDAPDGIKVDPPRNELVCNTYGPDAFVADADFVQQLDRKEPEIRKQVAFPPCVESVSTKTIQQIEDDAKAGHKLPPASASRPPLRDLFTEKKTALERFQNGFDFYSWLTFLALNAPPLDSDPKIFGTSDARTQWEEVFFPLEQAIRFHDDPNHPNFSIEHPPEQCKPDSGLKPTMFVTVDDVAYDQPFKSGPLVDQFGHYSLNTILVNPTMRDYIRHPAGDHSAIDGGPARLDTYRGQQAFRGTIDFPVGKVDKDDPKRGVLGAMMIKASWREMTPQDKTDEIHTAKAWLYFDDGVKKDCVIRTLGLVGFHVVHKTANRHQWIWTTFEHVRNVPSTDEVRRKSFSQTSYFFFDKDRPSGKCDAPDALPDCRGADTPNIPKPKPWRAIPPPKPGETQPPPLEKSQIVRAQEISPDTVKINKVSQEFLRSLVPGKTNVWSHYQLISTQWPANFDCASEARDLKTNEQTDVTCAPAPIYLPNSTLETYVQHDIGASGGAPQSTSSCIACHNNAVAYQKFSVADTDKAVSSPPNQICHGGDVACNTGSDFTFIFEQVCAPMPDRKAGIVGEPENGCKHDPKQETGSLQSVGGAK